MSTSNSSRCILPSLWLSLLSLDMFSTCPLHVLNPSAWNYKGHLHSEMKRFACMASDFKRSLYNNKHSVQNFYMWKLEERIIILLLWIFVQDQLFTRAACWGGSRIPGQITDPKETHTYCAGSTWHLRSWKYRQNSRSINDPRQLSHHKASLFAQNLYKNYRCKLEFA